MVDAKIHNSNPDPVDYKALIEAVPQDMPIYLLPDALEPIFRLLAKENPAKANGVLTDVIKQHFTNLTNKTQIAAYERTVREYAKQEKQSQASIEIETVPAEVYTTEELEAAEEILTSPTLLYDVLQMIKKLGVVGEEKNVLLQYLTITSRLLKQPLSVTIKGDSSAGKSFSIDKVLTLFPKSAYIDITDATAQSFYYAPADHFKHRTVIIFERHGSAKSDYAIRSLQSEGRVKIQVTIKNPITGQFESKEVFREGPTGFITTTTDAMIHAENETRNISIFPDQSVSQTSRVYIANEQRYLGHLPPKDDEIKLWQAAQTMIEQLPVLILFAPAISKYLPSGILRTRRDHGHLLAIIEVLALLHQKQREKVEKDGLIWIKATLADYEIARIIAEETLSKSIYELPPKTIEVIELARKLTRDLKSKETVDIEVSFSIPQLAAYSRLGSETVDKWMKPGTRKGYFTIVEEHRGSKPARYTVEDKDLPGSNFLPTAVDIKNERPNNNLEGSYNPLTGEVIDEVINVKETDTPPVCTDAAPAKDTDTTQLPLGVPPLTRLNPYPDGS